MAGKEKDPLEELEAVEGLLRELSKPPRYLIQKDAEGLAGDLQRIRGKLTKQKRQGNWLW